MDQPASGRLVSSDDHLHIPRPSADLDPVIAAWMQAEDIHVGNFLQMGMARDVHLTPQRAFGAASVYESGGTLLIGGQENPRTHVLGHGLLLGQRNWIDFRGPISCTTWSGAKRTGREHLPGMLTWGWRVRRMDRLYGGRTT